MTLTNEEYNVLNKLADKSKMDCWFYIAQDEAGNDYISDLEENKTYALAEGIQLLNEGLTDLADYDLTASEAKTYLNLLTKLNINFYKKEN